MSGVKSTSMFHAFAVTSCGVCVNYRDLDLLGKSSALNRSKVAFPAYKVVSGRFFSPLSQTHAILVSSSQIRAENAVIALSEEIWTFEVEVSEQLQRCCW